MLGTELHEACTVGDNEALEDYLLTGRYDVNMRDPEWQNRTPLHWASTKGYVDCVRLLLEHGAQGTARMSMGWTPAHSAAEAGKVAILRALHAAGVAVLKKDKYGDTALDVATTYGHKECQAFLRQVMEERAAAKRATSAKDSDSDSDVPVEPEEPYT